MQKALPNSLADARRWPEEGTNGRVLVVELVTIGTTGEAWSRPTSQFILREFSSSHMSMAILAVEKEAIVLFPCLNGQDNFVINLVEAGGRAG